MVQRTAKKKTSKRKAHVGARKSGQSASRGASLKVRKIKDADIEIIPPETSSFPVPDDGYFSKSRIPDSPTERQKATQFKQGQQFKPKGGAAVTRGRPKGSKDKLTREVKQLIEGALIKLGGVDYLVRIGKKRPALFVRLLERIIPLQVKSALAMPEDSGPALMTRE